MTANFFSILVLPGDGIGPEVTASAVKVLKTVANAGGLLLEFENDLVGGACYDVQGTFLRDETAAQAGDFDAILFGAEGGPKWDMLDIPGGPTAKSGLSRLRKELDLFANLRPVHSWPQLASRTPFRPEVIDGVDLIVFRELTSGVYFGKPRGIIDDEKGLRAIDTQSYTQTEIDRSVRAACQLARKRRGRVTSVDKANVMETGVLWRRRVSHVAESEFSDLEVEHLYADACLYELVRNPRRFDIILADNLFGDLLSDCAASIAGSLGMLPSASLGPVSVNGKQLALYEPVHGSAPDIAGQNVANPIAAILSAAMMLDISCERPDLAKRISSAVEHVLSQGIFTRDLGGSASCDEMTDAIIGALA